jgi:hypothetical protein
MMKKRGIMMLIFSTKLLLAESFFIFDKVYEFSSFNDVLVSNCQKKCEAKKKLSALKKVNLKKFTTKEAFANSPGSDVCRFVFQGESLMGQAQNRDRRAFCVFKDLSLIDINSLTLYLEEKKLLAP